MSAAMYDGTAPYRPADPKVIGPDDIDLERVEAVEAYRAWLRADRLHYSQPRAQRGAAPRMPALPSGTDYDHARAYAAL